MGYRPLEIEDSELEQICADIDTAETDRERLKHFKPLQELGISTFKNQKFSKEFRKIQNLKPTKRTF